MGKMPIEYDFLNTMTNQREPCRRIVWRSPPPRCPPCQSTPTRGFGARDSDRTRRGFETTYPAAPAIVAMNARRLMSPSEASRQTGKTNVSKKIGGTKLSQVVAPVASSSLDRRHEIPRADRLPVDSRVTRSLRLGFVAPRPYLFRSMSVANAPRSRRVFHSITSSARTRNVSIDVDGEQ
jgi:hypothetical protein